MGNWNKIILKTPNATVEEMITTNGSLYYSQSMLEEIIGTFPKSIEDGRGVYTNNKNIISFENGVLKSEDKSENINLNSLTITGDTVGNGMFENSSIKFFVGDLPSLENGENMFMNSDIEIFISYTSVLKDGLSMFSDCENLTEFCGDLSSLKKGTRMFYRCPNLTFDSIDLSSLENGENMFYGCHLGENEVRDIVKTFGDSDVHLTTTEMPRIDIGVTVDGLQSFYNETGFISFSPSYHVYNGKIFYIYPDENIHSWEDLDFGVIEYSDEDGSLLNISYPDNFWEEAEDISGLFVGDTQLIDFEERCEAKVLPNVKKARGTFYGVKSLTRFNVSMPQVEDIDGMFRECSALTSFTIDLSKCVSADRAFYKCSELTTFNSNLEKLKVGSYMFENCVKLTNFNPVSMAELIDGTYMFYSNSFTDFNYDMPKLKYGNYMFNISSLTNFNSDLSLLEDGTMMFNGTSLTNFYSNLNSLKIGKQMFGYTLFTDFNIDLPKLISGEDMFRGNTNLSLFTSDISSLKIGKYMFQGCSSLDNFNSNMPELEDGQSMFGACTSLTTFNGDLSKLENGISMFNDCTSLINCEISLPNLKDGTDMFYKCKLSGNSVRTIYDSLLDMNNVYSSYEDQGNITLGINSTYSSTASTNKSRLNTFGVNAGFTDWASLKQAFIDKGWNVTWLYAASDKVITV